MDSKTINKTNSFFVNYYFYWNNYGIHYRIKHLSYKAYNKEHVNKRRNKKINKYTYRQSL